MNSYVMMMVSSLVMTIGQVNALVKMLVKYYQLVNKKEM